MTGTTEELLAILVNQTGPCETYCASGNTAWNGGLTGMDMVDIKTGKPIK